MQHRSNYSLLILSLILFLLLSGCSSMTGVIKDAVLPSADKGIDVTAQVGKENTRALIANKNEDGVRIKEVAGNSTVTTVSTGVKSSTILAVLIPFLAFFLLLVAYILPQPKWLGRLASSAPS